MKILLAVLAIAFLLGFIGSVYCARPHGDSKLIVLLNKRIELQDKIISVQKETLRIKEELKTIWKERALRAESNLAAISMYLEITNHNEVSK